MLLPFSEYINRDLAGNSSGGFVCRLICFDINNCKKRIQRKTTGLIEAC
jgi:hypothetical protein